MTLSIRDTKIAIFFILQKISILRNMHIGVAIKELRVRAMMSQKKLASKSKVSQGYISNLENGRQNPQRVVLQRICKALGVPVPIVQIMSIDIMDAKRKKNPSFQSLQNALEKVIEETLNEAYE